MPAFSRKTCWLIVAASAAAFAGAMVPMTQRIADFNKTAHFARVHVEPQVAREFKLAGYPEVKLTDAITPQGASALKLEYAGATHTIPVKPPPVRDLPVLAGYEEWFKVLAVNNVITDPSGRSVPAPGTEHLFMVARRTPDGFDPKTWGTVRRVEWLFDIYELKPDGAVSMTTYRWPRSERSERNLTNRNAGEAPDPREVALQKLPRLDERSVQYLVAMHVIPKLSVPEHKFNDTAFSPRVLGWTLPVSMLAFLTLTGALVFAIAPRRQSPAA
jgi:hypothetical protein